MSHIPRLTMIGMYNYDSSIFDGLTLPEGADRSVFINSFLLDYGECRTLYPDVDFTKLAIANFSLKWSEEIERIYTALTAEYNPIHNYDRYEDNVLDMTGTITVDMDGTIESDRTSENTVSAFNETAYQPDSKNETDNTDTYDRTDKTTRNAKDSENKHMYGNIGVTTSQQMLNAEVELRQQQNFYSIISRMLYKEICLYYF